MITNGQNIAALWRPNPVAPDGYSLMDLNDYSSDHKWFLTSARYINTNGFIVGSGLHETTYIINGGLEQRTLLPRTYLLVPNVSLAVDYNRDGRIELNEKDDLPKETHFQFWVKDEDDSGDEARGR